MLGTAKKASITTKMNLPVTLIIAILETACEDLEYMLLDAEAHGDRVVIDEVYSQWRAVDEVLYDVRNT